MAITTTLTPMTLDPTALPRLFIGVTMPAPNKYIPYYDDIIEAMAGTGCAFCTLQLRAAERYIDALLWESVNDPRYPAGAAAGPGCGAGHRWFASGFRTRRRAI